MSGIRERLGNINAWRRKIAVEREHEVHSFLLYVCDKCGAVYVMHLEKGVADKSSPIHKPVPFSIVCQDCFGRAEHVINLDRRLGKIYDYRYLEPGENFFMYDPHCDRGIPIIFKKDYERLDMDALLSIISRWGTYTGLGEDSLTLQQMRREIIEKFKEKERS